MKRPLPTRVWVRILIVIQVALLASILWLAYAAWTTHEALCEFRGNLQQTQDTANAYIKAVETGAKPIIPGFTLLELQALAANRQKTLNSLSDLNC